MWKTNTVCIPSRLNYCVIFYSMHVSYTYNRGSRYTTWRVAGWRSLRCKITNGGNCLMRLRASEIVIYVISSSFRSVEGLIFLTPVLKEEGKVKGLTQSRAESFQMRYLEQFILYVTPSSLVTGQLMKLSRGLTRVKQGQSVSKGISVFIAKERSPENIPISPKIWKSPQNDGQR